MKIKSKGDDMKEEGEWEVNTVSRHAKRKNGRKELKKQNNEREEKMEAKETENEYKMGSADRKRRQGNM